MQRPQVRDRAARELAHRVPGSAAGLELRIEPRPADPVRQSRIDGVGALVSSACAVHCMIVPLVAASLPLIGASFFVGYQFEVGVLVTCVILASFSCILGHRRHGKWRVTALFAASIVLMLLAHVMHHRNLSYEARITDGTLTIVARNTLWNTVVMPLGGLLTAACHLLNRRHLKACSRCSCEGHAGGLVRPASDLNPERS